MFLGRPRADVQRCSNLLVGEPLNQEFQNVPLPRAQRNLIRQALRRQARLPAQCQRPETVAANTHIEHRFADVKRPPEGAGQRLRKCRLQQGRHSVHQLSLDESLGERVTGREAVGHKQNAATKTLLQQVDRHAQPIHRNSFTTGWVPS